MYLRVDDRLVHGQVVTAWVRELKSKGILVVDDQAAGNSITKKALKMATPAGVSLKVVACDEAGDVVRKVADKPVLVIVRSPMIAEKVVSAAPEVDWTVNVGNVGSADDRKRYSDSVYLDDENYQAAQRMLKRRLKVFMQTVPTQRVNQF